MVIVCANVDDAVNLLAAVYAWLADSRVNGRDLAADRIRDQAELAVVDAMRLVRGVQPRRPVRS